MSNFPDLVIVLKDAAREKRDSWDILKKKITVFLIHRKRAKVAMATLVSVYVHQYWLQFKTSELIIDHLTCWKGEKK